MATPSSNKQLRPNQVMRKRVQACQPWIRSVWGMHFAVALIILVCGIRSNRGKSKYIPVSPSQFLPKECRRAFVNTLAVSLEEEDGFICCEENDDRGICAPSPTHHILAGRLTRFPEAWVLPLVPLIFRWVVGSFYGASAHMESSLVRLGFYILVMNFRGWILFLLFNELEDHFGGSSQDSSDCWYEDFLSADQPGCYGRRFDFSDHTVLFFAQMLPIALVEVIHYVVAAPVFEMMTTNHVVVSSRSWLARATNFILVAYLIELYIVALMSVHKTAAYFHTGPEIMVGYALSMLIQLPLCFLQCVPSWHNARHLIFGFPR